MYVFTYGTLMKKYWNHHFLENEKFIGEGSLKGYEMYHVSSYPGIVEKEGEQIQGEVYEINEKILKSLDMLEAEGIMYLRRKEYITINERELEAYVYVWNSSIQDCEKVKEMPWKPKEWEVG